MKTVKKVKYGAIGSIFLMVVFIILWGTTYRIVEKDITQQIKPRLK